jgi:hypothetical protein
VSAARKQEEIVLLDGSSLFRVGDLSGFHGRFRAAAALT